MSCDRTKETREEFEKRYSNGNPDIFGKHKISMPCTCEDGGGPTHWAAIINTPEMIGLHLEDEALRLDAPIEVKRAVLARLELDSMPPPEEGLLFRGVPISEFNEFQLRKIIGRLCDYNKIFRCSRDVR